MLFSSVCPSSEPRPICSYSEFPQIDFVNDSVNTNKEVFPPGFEPGTFRVLGERDNHYTTETVKSFVLATMVG